MGTRRFWSIFRECVGSLRREIAVTLTPIPTPTAWVFIVGCYNSGTTLLSRLIESNKEVSGLPDEGQFLTDQFPADYELGVPRMWVQREDLFRLTEDSQGPDVRRLKKEWGARLDRSKPILLEKSPPNAGRTRWLQRHFENAHFIVLVRNGYAVSEGIRRKAEPYHLRDGWDIGQCAHQWARSNEILIEDSAWLERVLWVRYEDLTAAPAPEMERIFDFIGATRSELDPKGAWKVHEREDALRNMNKESIDRLSPEDRRKITQHARSMLQHFDYEVLDA